MEGEESRAFPGYILGEREVETEDMIYDVVECLKGYALIWKGGFTAQGLLAMFLIGIYELVLVSFAGSLPIKVGVVATNLKGGTWLRSRVVHKEVYPPGTDVEPRLDELFEQVKNGDFDHVWPKRKHSQVRDS